MSDKSPSFPGAAHGPMFGARSPLGFALLVIFIGLTAGLVWQLMFNGPFPWQSGTQLNPPYGERLSFRPMPMPNGVTRVREFVPNPGTPEWTFTPGRFVMRDHWNNEIIGGLKPKFVWQLGKASYLELADGMYKTEPSLGSNGTVSWQATEISPGVYELPMDAWGKVLCLELPETGGFMPATAAFQMTRDGRLTLLWGSIVADDPALPLDVQAAVKAMGDPATRPQFADSTQLIWQPGCHPAVSVIQAAKLSIKVIDEKGEPYQNCRLSLGEGMFLHGDSLKCARPRQTVVTDQNGRCEIGSVVGSFFFSTPGMWWNTTYIEVPSFSGPDFREEVKGDSPYVFFVLPGIHVSEAVMYKRRERVESEDDERAERPTAIGMTVDGKIVTEEETRAAHEAEYPGAGDTLIYLDHPKALSRHRWAWSEETSDEISNGSFFVFNGDIGAMPEFHERRALQEFRFNFHDDSGTPAANARLSINWREERVSGTIDGRRMTHAEAGPNGNLVVWAPQGKVAARFVDGPWSGVGMSVTRPPFNTVDDFWGSWLCKPTASLAVTRRTEATDSWFAVRATDLPDPGDGMRELDSDTRQRRCGRGCFFMGLSQGEVLTGEVQSGAGPLNAVPALLESGKTTLVALQSPKPGSVELSGPLWERLNGAMIMPRNSDPHAYRAVLYAVHALYGVTSPAQGRNVGYDPGEWDAARPAWRVVVNGKAVVPSTWVDWGMVAHSLMPPMFTEPGVTDHVRPLYPANELQDPMGDLVRPFTVRTTRTGAMNEVSPFISIGIRSDERVATWPADGHEHTIWVPIDDRSPAASQEAGNVDEKANPSQGWFLKWRYRMLPIPEKWEKPILYNRYGEPEWWLHDGTCPLTIPAGREPLFLNLEIPDLRKNSDVGNANRLEGSMGKFEGPLIPTTTPQAKPTVLRK